MARNLGIIKIQKLEHKKQTNLATKICASCGSTFEADADSKFVHCSKCHQKAQFIHKPINIKKNETQTFTQIVCIKCKSFSYLNFIPPNINAAYCNDCYSKIKYLSQKSKITN
jgi:protein-arginine kinase activator protein McsA